MYLYSALEELFDTTSREAGRFNDKGVFVCYVAYSTSLDTRCFKRFRFEEEQLVFFRP